MLRLNTIKKHPGATTSRKRLGRGSGSGLGATAGKGDKGQLARSGGSVRPGFEGGQMPMYRRIPKKGFTNIHRRSNAVVNLSELSKLGKSVKDVSLESLQEAGIVKGRFDRLTILATGEITQAFAIKAHRVSEAAAEKIKKAGGTINLIPIPEGKKREKKAAAQK
ncbi:MAG: 50S ribosomal protein L15 [Bdellovibrionales bacterium]|nr:50S ribosomal protein L15 [Bdellovibrionales bacterium]